MKGKAIGVIILLILLVVVIVIIGKNIHTTQTVTQSGQTNTVTNGLAGVYDWVVGLIKGKPYVTTGCDPNKPGYNLDGLYDNNCQ